MKKIILLVCLFLLLIAGSFVYAQSRVIKWEDEKVKTEKLVASLQNVITAMEYPLPKIKNYLDLASQYKETPVVQGTINEQRMSVYQEHYQTSLDLISKIKQTEALAKELLTAIQNKDEGQFRSIKKQLVPELKKVEGWAREYQESSDKVKALDTAK